MSKDWKKKLEEARDNAKKSPNNKKSVSGRGIAGGAAAGMAAGWAVTRHPLGGLAGAIIGGAAAIGAKSAFNESSESAPESENSKAGPQAQKSAEKGNPWSGKKRDVPSEEKSEGQSEPKDDQPKNKKNNDGGNGPAPGGM